MSEESAGNYYYAGGEKVVGDLPATSTYSEFDDGWLGFELALLDLGRPVEVPPYPQFTGALGAALSASRDT